MKKLAKLRAGRGGGVIWEMPKRKGVFFLGSLPFHTTGGLPCQVLPYTPPPRSRTLLPLWGHRNLFSARDWGKRTASHTKVSHLIEWCDRSIMLECLTTLHKPSEMASSSEVIKIGGSLPGWEKKEMKKVKVFKKNQTVILKQGKKRVKYSWHFYCFGTFLTKWH